MKRRKENYGFNKFNSAKFISIFMISISISVLLLSIGFSSFNKNLVMSNTKVMVRADKDVRVSGINVGQGISGAISNNEEYLDSSIYGDITLPTSDSTITYEVEVTNLGNVKVALANITDVDDRLEYTLTDYTLGETICDSSNNCINGVKKKFYITLKYKDGVTPSTTSIPFNIKFKFEQVYTVTYKNVDCVGCKTEALGNNPFTVKIDISNPKITMNNKVLSESEYSYKNGELTINKVDGDIIIEAEKQEVLCKAATEATMGKIPQGNYEYGDEYICDLGDTEDSKNLIFFVLETGDDNVSLIMNKNIGNLVPWCKSGSTGACAADGAKEELYTETSDWTKITDKSQITLPSADQIATASGKTFNHGNVSGVAKWLYDYLSGTTHPVSDVRGYWTSTPDKDYPFHSWFIYSQGYIYDTRFTNLGVNYGVRPVITISKSNLS